MLEPMPSKNSNTSPLKSSNKTSRAIREEALSSSSSLKDKASSSKSKHKEKHKSAASTSSSSSEKTPKLLTTKAMLPPLEDLMKDLPPPPEYIIPNDYKPMPVNPMVMDCVFRQPQKQPAYMLNEADALCASTTSKNQRTKVYSGVKTGALLTVPTLHELCIRFLQKNIDALEYTGGVPFEILRPILERASADQLYTFEHYNPYLMEDSDILWQQHCQRRFKAYKRLEMETWREMYFRCLTEQEERLNNLTEKVKGKQQVAVPMRQTKLCVDNTVKPPRNVFKKQIQFGTSKKLVSSPAARVEALSAVASNVAKVGDVRLKTLAALRDTAQAQPSSNGLIKPRKAPLMQKTLALMKGRFKR